MYVEGSVTRYETTTNKASYDSATQLYTASSYYIARHNGRASWLSLVDPKNRYNQLKELYQKSCIPKEKSPKDI